MTVRFAAEARRDIAAVLAMIGANSPKAAKAFEQAIEAAAIGSTFFRAWVASFTVPGRFAVSLPRWGYQMLYVDLGADGLFVLSVRSARRDRIGEKRRLETDDQ